MSIVTVVAKLIVQEAAVETVKTELLKMIEPTRLEEGYIEYSHLAPNHLTSAVNVLNSSMSFSTILAQNENRELRNVA